MLVAKKRSSLGTAEPPSIVSSNFWSGIAATFGMGVVSGEHEKPGSGLFDHPAERLTRERRELQVLADVVRRQVLEVAQRLLGALEGPLGVVEVAHPRHHPPGPLLDAATPQVGGGGQTRKMRMGAPRNSEGEWGMAR